jgi:hypothetical protein
MKMVSLKPHVYAGKRLSVGDEFEVSGRSDARLLTAIGRAIVAPPPAPEPPAPPPVSRPLARVFVPKAEAPAVAPVVAEPDSDEPKPKRTYRRRDLSAES